VKNEHLVLKIQRKNILLKKFGNSRKTSYWKNSAIQEKHLIEKIRQFKKNILLEKFGNSRKTSYWKNSAIQEKHLIGKIRQFKKNILLENLYKILL